MATFDIELRDNGTGTFDISLSSTVVEVIELWGRVLI